LSEKLNKAGIEDCRNQAEIMLSSLTRRKRHELYTEEIDMGIDQKFMLQSLMRRRSKQVPLQYLINTVNFMGLELRVSPAALIPRPETEIMVQQLIFLLNNTKVENPPRMLDIGTGCGNIIIAAAKAHHSMHGCAVDISPESLGLAKHNARRHKVDERIMFIESDLFENIRWREEFDIIASNPPYVSTLGLHNSATELLYEPRAALDGGKDGLDFYRRIINDSHFYLKAGGYLVLELGDAQAQEVSKLVKKTEHFSGINIINDLNKIRRVLIARKKR